jgi:hypothetical protein
MVVECTLRQAAVPSVFPTDTKDTRLRWVSLRLFYELFLTAPGTLGIELSTLMACAVVWVDFLVPVCLSLC